jgi:DNA-binding NarL/FixJ family response regulator
MKKIRILLANSRPRIMREVMRQLIKRQPDMEIVGEVLDLSALVRTAKETAADVIIVALEDSVALGLGSQLFAECPSVIILALASKGDAAFIEQVCHGRREIAEPSEANILSALRHAIQHPIACITPEHSC